MAWEWGTNWVNKQLSILIFICCTISLKAQTDSTEQSILIEELSTESLEINEEKNVLLMNKLNLIEFLNDIELYSMILKESQRNSILEHIKNTGNVIDLLELQSITDIDYSIYLSLIKIINIQQSSQLITDKYVKVLQRSTHQNNHEEEIIGSHWGMYQQVQIQGKQGIKIGLAREFDVGENTSKSVLNKYDHYAWFINYKTRKMELNIGNFQIYQGLGLLLGQGFSGGFGQGGINNIIQNRWKPTANQIEYNTFSGIYLNKKFKYMNINLGISKQRIDSINTFGIHRTESQLKSKNTASENLFLSSIDYSNRKYKASLFYLNNRIAKTHSISISNQLFLGSTTLFSELALHTSKMAYSVGLNRLINKFLQFNLSYTTYINSYDSEYASNTVQGITSSNINGLIFHMSYQPSSKWNINLTHKITSKDLIKNKSLGTSSDISDNLRIDKNIRNKLKWSMLLTIKNKEQEGKESFDFTERIKEYRTRNGINYSLNEKVQQDLFYYRCRVKSMISNAITYQLIIKTRIVKCAYVLSLHEINQGVPLYISSASLIQGRVTQAIYESGSMQQWSIGLNLNLFTIQLQYLKLNKVISNDLQNKLLLQIKYP